MKYEARPVDLFGMWCFVCRFGQDLAIILDPMNLGSHIGAGTVSIGDTRVLLRGLLDNSLEDYSI